MTKKILIALHIGILLVACAAAAGAYQVGFSRGTEGSEQQKESAYAAGQQELRAKLQASGVLRPPPEFRSISGQITAVGKDSLEIDAPQLITDPLDEPAPTHRRIVVKPETKIYRLERKTAEEIAQDNARYDQAVAACGENMNTCPDRAIPTPPTPQKETSITIADLKTGDFVTITADSELTRSTTIEATRIDLSTVAADGSGALPPPDMPVPGIAAPSSGEVIQPPPGTARPPSQGGAAPDSGEIVQPPPGTSAPPPQNDNTNS